MLKRPRSGRFTPERLCLCVAVFRLPAPRGGKRGTSALANPDSMHSVAVGVRVAAGGIAQRLISAVSRPHYGHTVFELPKQPFFN